MFARLLHPSTYRLTKRMFLFFLVLLQVTVPLNMKTPRADFAPSSGWQGSLHRTLGESGGTLVGDLNCWSKRRSKYTAALFQQFVSIQVNYMLYMLWCSNPCSKVFALLLTRIRKVPSGSVVKRRSWTQSFVAAEFWLCCFKRPYHGQAFHFDAHTFLFNWNRIVCHWNDGNQSTTRYERPVQGRNGLPHIEGNNCECLFHPLKPLQTVDLLANRWTIHRQQPSCELNRIQVLDFTQSGRTLHRSWLITLVANLASAWSEIPAAFGWIHIALHASSKRRFMAWRDCDIDTMNTWNTSATQLRWTSEDQNLWCGGVDNTDRPMGDAWRGLSNLVHNCKPVSFK